MKNGFADHRIYHSANVTKIFYYKKKEIKKKKSSITNKISHPFYLFYFLN